MTPSETTANFRDVGEALSLWIDPPPIPMGKLHRGGKFDLLATAAELGNPKTILNLRQGPDPTHLRGVNYIHVPAANDVENYNTSLREVRTWISKALSALANPQTMWPVYIHCTSGRDRTGLVVATALLFAGVPREVIVEEFLLSDGSERTMIESALESIVKGKPLEVDIQALKSALIRS
ncbi:MAG: tyrosine-protein phosphatase [Polyangiaceae bacterium]|nr:tyrosine-protein phosphatase [Polyangiaceae bacterium]